MSTAYHPETDGASERTNKTVIQALRYHVQRNQKGWVRALPRVRFDLMNTVNRSTGFTPFQLHLGRSPRLLPPLITTSTALAEEFSTESFIQCLQDDVAEARDNLLVAKVSQAFQANKHRGEEPSFKIGDFMMLNTANRRREYREKADGRTAKLMPRFDGKYEVVAAFPEASVYSINMPNAPLTYTTFHASELRPYHANDPVLFPSRELAQPGPVVTPDGEVEWLVESIVDERKRGRGRQYLVRFAGYGPDHDQWIARTELLHNEALDRWENRSS